MFIQLLDFFQMNMECVLQIVDDGFFLLQSLTAFIQLFLDLQVFLVKPKVFISELRSISSIRDYLLSFSNDGWKVKNKGKCRKL